MYTLGKWILALIKYYEAKQSILPKEKYYASIQREFL